MTGGAARDGAPAPGGAAAFPSASRATAAPGAEEGVAAQPVAAPFGAAAPGAAEPDADRAAGTPRADLPPPDPWADACAAADILALDPVLLGGARLRGRPGPARDAWLARLEAALAPGAPFRRVPVRADEARLLGGLDLAATLSSGRPMRSRGLLADLAGGVAVLTGAERAEARLAGLLARALDGADGRGLALVALDEGDGPDEAAPPALVERLGFDLPLDAVRPRPVPAVDAAAARARLAQARVGADLVQALAETAEALGVASPRALLFALRAARAAAALAGRGDADAADAALAARLTLGPRATRLPAAPEDDASQAEAPETAPPDAPPEPPAEPGPPSPPDAADPAGAERPEPPERADSGDAPLSDMLIAAARAALPAGLLAAAAAAERGRAGAGGGTAGALRRAALRGRPVGTRPGRPEGGARLDLVETLRAAAPWQPLRRAADPSATGPLVRVRREDFRLRRFRHPAETLTVFLVDASGSAAAQRLAEAKGAVELLLAESYVRRDRVALIAFRGARAETVLPATRAVARARRALGGLPGGGGTPLAAGLEAGLAEAEAALRHGWTPTLVLLTDGRANVARDGTGGRVRAAADAATAAARIRARGVAALVIDSAVRPNPDAAALAAAMGARYLALPRAETGALAAAVRGP